MPTEQSPDEDRADRETIRLERPSVVVLCGPAACGKSTFAERHFRPTQVISSDRTRALVCDDERDQRYQTQAFALLHYLIEQRLSINRLCVVDSTALTPQARRELLSLARKYQVPCVVILFDTPLEKCIERDRARERTVGAVVIERHYQLFEQARAAIRQEGFDRIIELRDEALDKVDVEIRFRPVRQPAPAAKPAERRFPPRPAQTGPAAQGAYREVKPFRAERRPAPPARVSPDARQSVSAPVATPATQAPPAAAPSAAPAEPEAQPASTGPSPEPAPAASPPATPDAEHGQTGP
jgi:predicted kinase